MKSKNLLFILWLLSSILPNNSCRKNQEKTEASPVILPGIIKIDATVSREEYPEKAGFEDKNVSMKLVPLETNDKFLCAGHLDVFTDSIIIYRNNSYKGGDILIFDGQGKALRKLSPGQSGKEYRSAANVVYDNNNKEIFVNDFYSSIKVFSLNGEFKRALPHPEEVEYHDFLNFDNESLICYTHDEVENPVFLISKQTGEKLQDIIIPYKKRLTINQRSPDGSTLITTKVLVKTHDGIIISEPSSDTIYHLSYENTVLRPILYRTPSIQTMKAPVFVSPDVKVDSTLFLRVIRKEDEDAHPRLVALLMCDYNNGGIYHSTRTGLPISHFVRSFVIHETRSDVFLTPLPADYLVEELKANKLTGEAKEIASRLKDDDNDVLAIFTIQH
jgi:hypothetical protein